MAEAANESLPGISYPSLFISFAFLCQLTNFIILRDGLTLWNFIFVQQTQFMVDLQIIFLIEASISMIIGAILYEISSKNVCVIGLFSIGVIIGNAIILKANNYYMTPLDENIVESIKLGYGVAFACMGASLPCMLDYGFAHLPDNNNNFKKNVAVFAGFIFLFWIASQIIAWHALIVYKKKSSEVGLPPTPLNLSIFVLIFIIFGGAVDQFQKYLQKPPPKPVEDDYDDDENDHVIQIYYITICSSLFSVGMFYYLKGQLVPYWLTYVNTMVSRKIGGILYNSDTVNEQYLYWMVFAWFVCKLILFRYDGIGPVLSSLIAIGLTIYILYFSRGILLLIRHRFDGRFTYPDYDNQKFIFINMMAALLKIQFTYSGSGKQTHLISSAGYFEIDRLQEHFFIKRFDVSYYQILYFGAISISLKRKSKFGKSPPCRLSLNKWNCPQILAAVTYNHDISEWDYQPYMQIHLTRLDAYCPNENVYQTSSLYALACIRLSPITADKLKFHFISLQTGRTYPLEQHVLTPLDECYYLPPGIYGIELEQPTQVLINMDKFDFGPGGSYFIFVALHDTILEGKGGSKYSKIYYKQNVAFPKVWQKPITLSITFLFGQFAMLGIAEMLIFTSCLEFIYSRRGNKSHPMLIAIFFALIQFGFIWHLHFPQVGASMYNFSTLNMHSLFLLLSLILIGVVKLLQFHTPWTGRIRFYIGEVFKRIIRRSKNLIFFFYNLLWIDKSNLPLSQLSSESHDAKPRKGSVPNVKARTLPSTLAESDSDTIDETKITRKKEKILAPPPPPSGRETNLTKTKKPKPPSPLSTLPTLPSVSNDGKPMKPNLPLSQLSSESHDAKPRKGSVPNVKARTLPSTLAESDSDTIDETKITRKKEKILAPPPPPSGRETNLTKTKKTKPPSPLSTLPTLPSVSNDGKPMKRRVMETKTRPPRSTLSESDDDSINKTKITKNRGKIPPPPAPRRTSDITKRKSGLRKMKKPKPRSPPLSTSSTSSTPPTPPPPPLRPTNSKLKRISKLPKRKGPPLHFPVLDQAVLDAMNQLRKK